MTEERFYLSYLSNLIYSLTNSFIYLIVCRHQYKSPLLSVTAVVNKVFLPFIHSFIHLTWICRVQPFSFLKHFFSGRRICEVPAVSFRRSASNTLPPRGLTDLHTTRLQPQRLTPAPGWNVQRAHFLLCFRIKSSPRSVASPSPSVNLRHHLPRSSSPLSTPPTPPPAPPLPHSSPYASLLLSRL